MSHTRGPWRVIIDDTGGEFSGWPSIEAAEELDISIIHRAGFNHEYWEFHPNLPETLANARLIAAAPDMLAALKAAPQYLLAWQHQLRKETEQATSNAHKKYVVDSGAKVKADLERIIAAITKAEGE